MAKLELLSRTQYDADGVQTVWDFNFAGGYILPEHVKAYYELGAVRTTVVASLVGTNQVYINPPVPAGAVLTIYRDTPKNAPLVDFVDRGTVSEVALDTVAKQAVFVAAEAADSAATAATDVAVNAAATAQSAALSASVGSASAAASALAAAESAANAGSGATAAVNLHKSELAASVGSALIGWLSLGTGAVPTTVQTKLRQTVHVRDFGAVGDGIADDTAAMQLALSFMSTIGSGTVLADGGKWRLTSKLTVPSFVFLKGGDFLPDPSNGAHVFATSLFIDWGANQNNHAVELSHSSGISGFTFYYPGQVAKTATTPIEFGFSISTPVGGSVYDNVHVTNITLYNSYRGIRLHNAGRFNLDNIQGDPLLVGIDADNCLDVSRMSKVHFWNFYTQSAALETWVAENGTAYDLKRIDQLFASKLFSWNRNIAYKFGSGLWADFQGLTCDKANYPVLVDGATQVSVDGFVLISNGKVRPAIWGKSVGTSARFSNGRITDTSSVGAQIDSGSFMFSNVDFSNRHASVVCTSDVADVRLDENCKYVVPPFGSYEVRLAGERLPKASTVVTLPAPITAPTAIASGYKFDLSTVGDKVLQYETTYISQRNSLYVLEFDYELVGESTTWYFRFGIKNDVGGDVQVSYEPLYPLVINGTAGAPKKVRIPFFINHGRFKQVMTIIVTPTTTVAGAALNLTNIRLMEQENKLTSDAQVSTMMRMGYNSDAFNMGQTLFSKGKNRIVLTRPEAGIGRPTEAPTAGAWLQGDEVRTENPAASGFIGQVCTVSGTPGTWKTFGSISA